MVSVPALNSNRESPEHVRMATTRVKLVG